MTSNEVSVSPVSTGPATNFTSLDPNQKIVVLAHDNYLPEIAVITLAICFIVIAFFILFPKRYRSE
jgi:hypothetical protein